MSAVVMERCEEIKITELELSNLLKRIGIPCNISGFGYIKASVDYLIGCKKISEEKFMYVAITKDLYPAIAKRFGTTNTRVERAIRHAVEKAWQRGDIEILNDIFGYSIDAEKGKTTNSEFLFGICEYLFTHPGAFVNTISFEPKKEI